MPPKKVLITNFRGPHTTLVDVPNNNINVKTSTLTTQEKVKIDTKEINYEYPEPELDMDDNRTPDTINITYKYDVNIILIHEVIRKKFAFERGKLNNYEVKIKQIDKINPNSLSLNEYKRLQKDKLELLNKIEEINIGRKWELYVSRARPYLEAYQSLPGQRNRNLVIIGKKVEKEEDKTNIENRLSIIKSYINIASESIDINASKIEKNIAVCPVCETEFKDFEIDEDIGICTCTGCGWFRENLAKSSCNKDNGRTSSNNKNDYEDRENFHKSAIRFACKQTKTFHCKLEEDLDEYFTRNDVPSGKEVRSQPTIKGRKKGVNFSMMIRALATLSKPRNPALNYREIYSEYYEDVWLIMHNYWGFTPNNIMHLIPDLMDIYDRTQKEYIALTTAERGGRDASLNTQYRLCVQLLALGFPCQKSDFKIQTRESLENHQRIWKIMCARSGVKFHEII
jgi:hypothetical protein